MKKSHSKKLRIMGSLLILCSILFFSSIQVFAENPCKKCIEDCCNQLERALDLCDYIKYTRGYAACVVAAKEAYDCCILQCQIEYDADCDEFLPPDGSGGGGATVPIY